jgi:hypothetical protein
VRSQKVPLGVRESGKGLLQNSGLEIWSMYVCVCVNLLWSVMNKKSEGRQDRIERKKVDVYICVKVTQEEEEKT